MIFAKYFPVASMASILARFLAYIVIVLLTSSVAGADASGVASVVLIENGRSIYDIVIKKEAPQGAHEAALELQRLIKISTGVELEIKNSHDSAKRHIYIGRNVYSDAALIDVDVLPKDGFKVKVKDENLYLVGADNARQPFYSINLQESASSGSYYAVLFFCAEFLGARWYMPGPKGEELNRLNVLKIPADLDVTDYPRFKIRYIDVASKRTIERQNILLNQKKIRTRYYTEDDYLEAAKWGRHLKLGNNTSLEVGHAWGKWIPGDKPNAYSPKFYGHSHPEYFASKRVDGSVYYGKNKNLGGQLCICNPDVADEMADNIIRYSKKTGIKAFSLSPNDGGKWDCQCDCCRKDKRRFKKGSPALTEEVIKFANSVVDRVVKEVPDAEFGLYAYSWMSEPPESNFANQRIVFSDVYNGLPFEFHIQKRRREIFEKIDQWRERAKNVVLTSYYTYYGNYSMPWSTLDVQQTLIDALKKHPSSTGLRLNYTQYDVAPMGMTGPDPWVMSQLMWNPDLSTPALLDEYYAGAFGEKAGELVRFFYETINKSMISAINSSRFSGPRGVGSYLVPAYKPILQECDSLLAHASRLVASENENIQWRFSRVSKAWELAKLTVVMIEARDSGDIGEYNRARGLRRNLVSDRDSVFSIGAESLDIFESMVPLEKK